jgi:hypothetical protein
MLPTRVKPAKRRYIPTVPEDFARMAATASDEIDVTIHANREGAYAPISHTVSQVHEGTALSSKSQLIILRHSNLGPVRGTLC